MKFGTLQQMLNPIAVTWPKIHFFFKLKMAATAIAILAITHRPIVGFWRNFVWGSRTACWQGLLDKNCKFLKSKMADGRHCENRWSPSQWKLVRFRWNLVHYSKYWTRLQSRDQELKFLKFKMAATAILKMVISPYLSENFFDFSEIWYTTSDIEPDYGPVSDQ